MRDISESIVEPEVTIYDMIMAAISAILLLIIMFGCWIVLFIVGAYVLTEVGLT